MSASAHSGAAPYYFVPAPSRYPALVALGMFFVILGAFQWINHHGWGKYSLLLGLVIWLSVMFQWFRTAIADWNPIPSGSMRPTLMIRPLNNPHNAPTSNAAPAPITMAMSP